MLNAKNKENHIALLILAHDESVVIRDTVAAAHNALTPGDTLFVVADNCTDDTAGKAHNAGARVIIRNNGVANGKGEALAWFLSQYRDELLNYCMVVILDADSMIPPDFIRIIISNISEESQALQCFVYPLYENKAPIGKLAALSELLDQYVSDNIRTALGWPVRLRGTGMVLKSETLIDMGNRLQTKVEDIALSLLLTARGIRIQRINDAVVFDPKPRTSDAAARQRARWFRGQWQAMWQYRREIVRVLVKGPAGWSLLSSLFLKPKWLVLTTSLLMALTLSHWPWLALFFWVHFLLGLLYVLLGLSLIPDRKIFIRAMFHAPAYVWMWLQGITLSFRPSSWLRARK